MKSAVLPAIPNSMLKFVLSEAIFDPFFGGIPFSRKTSIQIFIYKL